MRRAQISSLELVAIYESLPPESASVREASGAPFGLDGLLLASIFDAIHALGAGKKLKKEDLLATSFSKQGLDEKVAEKNKEAALVRLLRESVNKGQNPPK